MPDEQRARLVRCERHGLAFDPQKATGCALCRSDPRRTSGFPPLDRVMVGLLAAILVMLLGGVLVHVATPRLERWLAPDDASAPVAASASAPALRSGNFSLSTKNGAGRSGMLFIPAEAAREPRPLLIVFHGTGGSGASMLASFASVARQRGVIVLAPDSGRSPDGAYNWQVPDRPNDPTPDTTHVLACLDELYATPRLRIDPRRVLAAGHSGGGSTAAYFGTNDPRVRAFAVLHGGVFASGLGDSRARAWFSTGTLDTLRPPEVVQRAAAATEKHASGVTFRLYPGGHGLSSPEIEDVMAWWLDG